MDILLLGRRFKLTAWVYFAAIDWGDGGEELLGGERSSSARAFFPLSGGPLLRHDPKNDEPSAASYARLRPSSTPSPRLPRKMGYLPALRYLLHHGIDHYVGDELKTNSYPVLLPSTEKKGRARPGDCRTPAHVVLPIVRSRCKHATYLSLDVGERPNGHGLPFYGLERRRRGAQRSADGGATQTPFGWPAAS